MLISTQTEGEQRLLALDPKVPHCPELYYRQLFADGAPAYDEGPIGWVVPGYEDLSSIVGDTGRFSSRVFGEGGPTLTGISPEPFSDEVKALLEELPPMANTLLIADPPPHTRQKALVLKALNANRVRQMEPMIRQIADDLIDGFLDDGRFELLEQFAIWLPMTTICTVLGADRKDMRQFREWTELAVTGAAEALDNPMRAEVLRAVNAYGRYLLERIAERRAEPQDDLLSDLVNAELDADDAALEGVGERVPRKLTDSEILSVVLQLLSAGNHTTTSLIGNALVLLIRHPEAMAEVRADYSLIPSFLEEALRIEAPVRCTYRVAPQGGHVRGATIPPASMVAMAWGAAGHDPAVFPEPDKFDIHRANAKRHLSFGHGPHFCVGNQLVRTQTRIGFERLLDRLHDLRIIGEPKRIQSFAFMGYEAVDLTFTKAQPKA
jgi:cytochrome P450